MKYKIQYSLVASNTQYPCLMFLSSELPGMFQHHAQINQSLGCPFGVFLELPRPKCVSVSNSYGCMAFHHSCDGSTQGLMQDTAQSPQTNTALSTQCAR